MECRSNLGGEWRECRDCFAALAMTGSLNQTCSCGVLTPQRATLKGRNYIEDGALINTIKMQNDKPNSKRNLEVLESTNFQVCPLSDSLPAYLGHLWLRARLKPRRYMSRSPSPLTGGRVGRHPARIYSRWDMGNGRGRVRVSFNKSPSG